MHINQYLCWLGASRGVGRSIALAYATAGAAKLALIGRSQKALSETERLVKQASASCQTFIHIIDIGAEDFDDKVHRLVQVCCCCCMHCAGSSFLAAYIMQSSGAGLVGGPCG